jgi:hypothetical protein
MSEDKLSLTVRKITGEKTSKYVSPDNVLTQLRFESVRKDINHILLDTTRPLGCVVIEAQKDAKDGWKIHRTGEGCRKSWIKAILEPLAD